MSELRSPVKEQDRECDGFSTASVDASCESDVLRVDGLSVASSRFELVKGISFKVQRGDRVGIIGESGSGKSMTALAIMGLLPEGVKASGAVIFGEAKLNLVTAREGQLSRLRGRDLSMVFQEPMSSLNPTMRVGKQVAEVLAVHRLVTDAKGASERVIELLKGVGLPDPDMAVRAYPHELSGGQRQRVVLAIAMAGGPQLMICDEPTTALDVSVQAQILDLIGDSVKKLHMSLMFISHDLAVVSQMCDRVLVMYGGRLVESGDIEAVFCRPRHPYTLGMLRTSDLWAVDENGNLPVIPGHVPAAGRFPEGCVFRNRCERADDICLSEPPLTADETRAVACWHPVL